MKKLLSLLLLLSGTALAADENFLDVASLDASSLRTENGATVAMDGEGLKLTFPSSKSYPGVDLTAPDRTWDLSAFSGIIIELANESDTKVGVSARVENNGDWQQKPWNSETTWLNAGAGGSLTITFGQSFGQPGFELDPAAVKQIKIFVNSPPSEGAIVIRSVRGVPKP